MVKAANLGRWVHHGQFPGINGVKPSSPLYQRMRFCSARMAFHWYINRIGTHVSLRGNYMVKLRAFTERAEAKGRESRNRDPEWLSSSRMDPEIQRDVRRQEPEDLSPRCKSRRWFHGCLNACTPLAPVRSADLIASD